jgi:HEAT repeat protein
MSVRRYLFVALVSLTVAMPVAAQGNLTPLQQKIEEQRRRLTSAEVEERRDALMKLTLMNRTEASRAAASALNDAEPIIRVSAAHAISALPPDEAAALLIPQLKDKLEFVRREMAHALGETHSRAATSALTDLLVSDKEASVRAAAAIALGRIRDDSAVTDLVQVLAGTSGKKKSKLRENEFVLRAAAEALGEIRNRAGVSVLMATLGDDSQPIDVRRAAATALGLIGDPQALPALKAAHESNDPYLAAAARASIRKLESAKN